MNFSSFPLKAEAHRKLYAFAHVRAFNFPSLFVPFPSSPSSTFIEKYFRVISSFSFNRIGSSQKNSPKLKIFLVKKFGIFSFSLSLRDCKVIAVQSEWKTRSDSIARHVKIGVKRRKSSWKVKNFLPERKLFLARFSLNYRKANESKVYNKGLEKAMKHFETMWFSLKIFCLSVD